MPTAVQPQYRQYFATTGPISGHTEDRVTVFQPRLAGTGGPLVMWCHGAGENGYTAWDGLIWIQGFIGRLCSLGVTVIAPDLGDPAVTTGPTSAPGSWGIPALSDRMDAYRQWAGTALGVDAATMIVCGYSMGAASVLGYARDYPAKVARLSAWNPCWDMATIRAHRADTGRSATWALLAPAIDAAWGISATDPTPAKCDLITQTPLQSLGSKARFYYSTNDPIVDVAWASTMAAWTGGTAHDAGATAHFPVTVGEPNTPFDEWAWWANIT